MSIKSIFKKNKKKENNNNNNYYYTNYNHLELNNLSTTTTTNISSSSNNNKLNNDYDDECFGGNSMIGNRNSHIYTIKPVIQGEEIIIEDGGVNYTSSTSNSNSNNNNKYIESKSGELFKIVFFKNIITKNQIIHHLKLFNIHYHNREFTLFQLKNYKYKEYLRSISIKLDNTRSNIYSTTGNDDDESTSTSNSSSSNGNGSNSNNDKNGELTSKYLKSILPNNIKCLEFPSKFNTPILIGSLSEFTNLTTIKFGKHFNCQLLNYKLLPPKLKKLQFSESGYHQQIPVDNFKNNEIATTGNAGSTITWLSMGDNGNVKIKSGSIPVTVKKLIIGNDYNHKIKPGMLPPMLESLTLGTHFNSTIMVNSLPQQSLTSLILNNEFNQEIKLNQLPSSITYLELSFCFNHSFKVKGNQHQQHNEDNDGNELISNSTWLPSNLKTLILGYKYNKKIDVGVLPKSLTHLEFGYAYNHSLDKGCLPDSLLKLKLSSSFTCKLQVGSLPKRLEYLDMGQVYNEPLEIGLLPESLTFLKLSNTFTQLIQPGIIPSSLKHLEFGFLNKSWSTTATSTSIFPNNSSLTKLVIAHTDFSNVKLPPSLTSLHLLHLKRNIELNEIPKSVTHLFIENLSFDLNPASIPSWIEQLEFGKYFNRAIDETWFETNSNLKSLKVGYFFNQLIKPNTIPKSVEHFECGLRFNQDITRDSVLPKSLTSLALNDSYPIIDFQKLPPSLTSLSCYNTNQLLLNHLNIDDFYLILKVLKNLQK